MDAVEVVLANNDRVTLRVGDTFLKVDADRQRSDREVEAMALAPVPTPAVRWRQPPVLALAALQGGPLGRLGQPSNARPEAWAAAGATVRALHDAPPPPWPGKPIDALAARLATAVDWLVANDVLPVEVVDRSRRLADGALSPSATAFIHGDLHIEHVFVDGDEVTGIIDWSEAAPGDPLADLASLTLGNEQHLDAVIGGYGRGVDRDLVRAWWSLRCLVVIPWLADNDYGPTEHYPEVAILRSL